MGLATFISSRRSAGRAEFVNPAEKGKHKMIMTLTVFKEVHNTWPPKNGKPGGEAYDLLCMDMSNPAEHRMEEMLYTGRHRPWPIPATSDMPCRRRYLREGLCP